MQVIFSRTYPFLDTETLSERYACDTLFRIDENEFLLYMTSGAELEDERLVWLDGRAALLWVNQDPEDYGIDWR
jgi:hypothetical protein